eukprot:3056050-Pyramimonas_sp.AAC.1
MRWGPRCDSSVAVGFHGPLFTSSGVQSGFICSAAFGKDVILDASRIPASPSRKDRQVSR